MGDATGGDSLRDISLDDIRAAAERIEGRVTRTPLLGSRTAARLVEERTGIRLAPGPPFPPLAPGPRFPPPAAGPPLAPGPPADDQPRVFLKAEHLQVTGSFKVRGATNRVLTLTADERSRGIISLSAGNHAQAVAYAGGRAGIPVTVVMPANASRAKAEAAAAYGAEVVLHGAHVGEAFAEMERIRDERGLFFLHPFDDPGVIAGQASVALEILADLPGVDVVVAGIGGGGLVSGVGAALKRLRPGSRVYGVEPEHSNALTLGLAAGKPVPLEPRSIADGLGAPFAGVWTIDLARRYVDDIVLVDEATIALGVRFALERMKQLLEPAGAAALGAILAGRIPLRQGDTVCAVASGGNVDLARLPEDPGAGRTSSVVAQGAQALVVEARVVTELMDHRPPDLLRQVARVGEVLLQRYPEEGDLVGEGDQIGGVLHDGRALVEPVQPAVVVGLAKLVLLGRRPVLDDHGDALEETPDLRWQAVERALDEDLERADPAARPLWRPDAPGRVAASESAAATDGHRCLC